MSIIGRPKTLWTQPNIVWVFWWIWTSVLVQDTVLTGHTTEIVQLQEFSGLNPNHTEISGKPLFNGHDLSTINSLKSRNHHYLGADVNILFLTLLWFLLAMLAYQKMLLCIFVSMKKLSQTRGPWQHLMNLVIKQIGLGIRRKQSPHTPWRVGMGYP